MSTRVLLVEDSEIAAELLRRLITTDGDLEVVVTVTTGTEALRSHAIHGADVVVLDLVLPDQSGLSLLPKLSAEVPVVAVSDLSADSPIAAEAVARGATRFVSKRSLNDLVGAELLRQAIRDTARRARAALPPVVAIVGSTGALTPLSSLLRALEGQGAGILLVQHFPEDRVDSFATWLSSMGPPARIARTGASVTPGQVLVAPGGSHMVLQRGGRIGLTRSAPIGGNRPSGTVLFQSLVWLPDAPIVVVLSGLGNDGSAAVPELIAAGATVIAQSPESSRAPSMPRSAIEQSRKVQSVDAKDLGRAVTRALRRAR